MHIFSLLLHFFPLDINVAHYDCTDYDTQLVGGASPNEGKVLMCLNGVWGTLCDETFSKTDAQIVCYDAGYSGGMKHL